MKANSISIFPKVEFFVRKFDFDENLNGADEFILKQLMIPKVHLLFISCNFAQKLGSILVPHLI